MNKRVIFCCVFSLLIGVVVPHFLYAQRKSPNGELPIPSEPSGLPKPNESPLFIERYAELLPEERVSVQVYENCNKSVVNVDTRTMSNVTLGGFIVVGEANVPGMGSGVVLDKTGHILTNSHVVSGVDSIAVTLFNGETVPAAVVGEDPITDIAVIKINVLPELLFPATIGDSSKLLVGQRIFAIGNPFGLERTLTGGIISSLNRTIPGKTEGRTIRGTIQIDAAINPGNSGGALLDTQGRLIGMNTAIASKTGGSHGVGFAIPVNTVARIVPQLIKSGKIRRGESGIAAVREVEKQTKNGVERGLMIVAVIPKSAAMKAGLKGVKITDERTPLGRIRQTDISAADIILAVDGVETKQADLLTAVIDERKPGDKVVLRVLRSSGSIENFTLTLE